MLNVEISCFFFLCSVPFNTEKLLGFYFELCVQMFTVHFYMLIFSSTYSLFDSFHSFTDVMISDYTIASETLKEQLTKTKDENRLQVKQFLAESIQLHAGAIRWNDLCDNELQVIIKLWFFYLKKGNERFTDHDVRTIILWIVYIRRILGHQCFYNWSCKLKKMETKFWNRLTNCCTYLSFVMQSIREDNLLSYDTFFSLNNLLIQTIFCYVLCYFSTKMSFNASRFATITYDSTWYEYPVEQQKCIILMIKRSQKSFGLSGYGIISCSMATFLSVCLDIQLNF